MASGYHPQSQSVLKDAIKPRLKSVALTTIKIGVKESTCCLLLNIVEESLGFSPFALVFGQTVSGQLQVLKEEWLKDRKTVQFMEDDVS